MTEDIQNNNGEVTAETAVASVGKGASKPNYAQFILPAAILLAALIVSGTLLYTRNGNKGVAQIGGSAVKPDAKVDIKLRADDHVLGNNNAKVTMVEFSDFQCPFCRSFWSGALPEIKKQYIDTGKAKLVYRHFPLSFHPAAHISAEASECAAEQGKFWEYHDKMFTEQDKLGQGTIQYGKPELKKWASQIGLSTAQFNECLDSSKYKQKVDDDIAYGSQVGVSGTPTAFINGQRIVGAQPFGSFKAVIDSILSK